MARTKQTPATETVTETPVTTETKGNPVLAAHDIDALRTEYKTKSAVIRFLLSRNFKRADIARALKIKYQFVRNVEVQAAEKAARAE